MNRRALSFALVGVGLLQPLGFVTGLKAVRGVGIALVASPLPLVFSHFRGLETFAADFSLNAKDGAETRSFAITPELYREIGGPYNRRNVYGAAIAFGPKLVSASEQKLWKTVLQYAFCNQGPFSKKLGLPSSFRHFEVVVDTKTRNARQRHLLEVDCP